MSGKALRLAVLAICTTGVAAGGVALASIPGPGGVIDACYSTNGNKRGELRVIDSGTESCRKHENRLSWNQGGLKGEKGDPGPKGDRGEKGDKGDKGDPGVSGYEVVRKTEGPLTGEGAAVVATCPIGKRAIGGGFVTSRVVGLMESAPSAEPSDGGRSWIVRVRSVDPVVVTAVAVCAST